MNVSAPANSGEMPHSRAPTRLTAVARSALPYSVRPKNSASAPISATLVADTSRLCTLTLTPPTVNDADGERRRARAFGAEEPQAEAQHREMQRDRDDQQHQHARLGQRLVRDPVQQRPERGDRGQRRARPARRAAAACGASHHSSAAMASGTPHHSASARGRRRTSPARTQRHDFHHAGDRPPCRPAARRCRAPCRAAARRASACPTRRTRRTAPR